ncbi:ergothioneine biosynthesis glutamate--cysteine ligase EgtA [Rhodococcus sp. 05-2255-1e]|uniref:ergothioneine biosynthesis glutamate--cysteine ligase EgtA n=1 Tax=Rhodococcus sp. 05-2255-1e TaxID=2022495 RepID=UPI000B9AEC5A|nr:ergothioneine biosynthesis glutamate--cysteine ligase EgtA [Rhodococcus sp. 05-2255-1e]OZE29797.1 ergothioneine biosynthesis glutamate--cysteine ligase EgtA [Rhodococcus sp. 05-2255-1e]
MSSNEKSLELSTRPAIEAYVSKVCFKLGPPSLIGAELEWLTALDDGSRPSLSALAAALGDHSPRSIAPESPALTLPGGSIVTVEPGGQVELSSSPSISVSQLEPLLDADARLLHDMLGRDGISISAVPADAVRDPERLLVLPRYCAMENRFTTIGPFGKLMMCNTAATQVSVDAGRDRAEVTSRWQMLHAIGPAFVAAFARSPELAGAPTGAWASQRMRTWLELDSSRTTVPNTGDPIADYARWALDVPLLCIRGTTQNWEAPSGIPFAQWLDDPSVVGRPATYADLDYHLTTLFPHVRACGHLEIRYLDAQPDGQWVIPAAAFEALLSTPGLVSQATELGAGTAGRWLDAARAGLADGELRRAASDVLDLASSAGGEFSQQLRAASRRCRAGISPHEFDAVSPTSQSRKESV